MLFRLIVFILFQVVISRVAMAAPGMFCLPVIMQRMEKKPWFKSRPVLHAPFQVLGVGVFLLGMVPLACSIFPQTVSVTSESLRWKISSHSFIFIFFYAFPGLLTQRHSDSCRISTETRYLGSSFTIRDCKEGTRIQLER